MPRLSDYARSFFGLFSAPAPAPAPETAPAADADRTFDTRTILACIHAFPMIMAVEKPKALVQRFDELRAATPKIAGVDFPTDHMTWAFAVAPALKDVLSAEFNAMAKEPLPDNAYWHTIEGPPDAAKIAALATWLAGMEAKYGKTQTVPDIRDKVLLKMETLNPL